MGSYDLNRIRCEDGSFVDIHHRCLMDVDHYGQATGCKDGSHLRVCAAEVCPLPYRKCPDAYCIPPQMLCDGKADCPQGDDEHDCGRYTPESRVR